MCRKGILATKCPHFHAHTTRSRDWRQCPAPCLPIDHVCPTGNYGSYTWTIHANYIIATFLQHTQDIKYKHLIIKNLNKSKLDHKASKENYIKNDIKEVKGWNCIFQTKAIFHSDLIVTSVCMKPKPDTARCHIARWSYFEDILKCRQYLWIHLSMLSLHVLYSIAAKTLLLFQDTLVDNCLWYTYTKKVDISSYLCVHFVLAFVCC